MKRQKWARTFAAVMAGFLAFIMLASLVVPYLAM